MSTTAVIGLGLLAWVLLAVPLALFVGRMIRLRDRQRPDPTGPRTPAESKPGDGTEPFRTPSRWSRRNKT